MENQLYSSFPRILPQFSSLYDDLDGILDMDAVINSVPMAFVEALLLSTPFSVAVAFGNLTTASLNSHTCTCKDLVRRYCKLCVSSKMTNRSSVIIYRPFFLVFVRVGPSEGFYLRIHDSWFSRIIGAELLLIPNVGFLEVEELVKSSRIFDSVGLAKIDSWSKTSFQ